MNVLVVFDHPRRKSLSGAVLDQFVDGLKEAGHVPEIADLHAENFDPRMPVEDEPDLCGANNTYTEAVMLEQARVERNGGIAFIFPVWWWSKDAISIRLLWALCRRSVPCRPATASKNRMSENRVMPLKCLKHRRFGNGRLRSAVQAPPAAPPQVRSEPKGAVKRAVSSELWTMCLFAR